MNNYDQLLQAKELLDKGVITEEEFAEMKKKLLASETQSTSAQSTVPPQNTYVVQSQPGAVDMSGATTGMKVLSCLIPLAGLILFIVDKDKKPVAAKEELMWAGIGFGVSLVLLMFTGL